MGNYHARFYEGLGRGDTPSLLSSGNNSQFTYDPYGRIVQIVETTASTVTSTKQFVWANGRMREARNASGAVSAQYFDYGEAITGASYFWTKDYPGSIREMTNLAGAIVSQFAYDPYGKVNQSQASVVSDFQYAGYYHHSSSGFGLTLNRAYNAGLGKWINRDPIGETAGANLFSYCKNNPVCFIDPLGLKYLKGHLGGDGVQAPADPAIECPVKPPPCVPRYAPPPPLEGYTFRNLSIHLRQFQKKFSDYVISICPRRAAGPPLEGLRLFDPLR